MFNLIKSLHINHSKAITACVALSLSPNLAFSISSDAQECTKAISHYENHYQIPSGLLHAIAVVESGVYDKEDGRIYPWPWSVNIRGRSHFFPTRDEAVNFVASKLRQGIKNIDVGCNQINLMHHGKNFPTLTHAFDPHTNTRFAAKFLQTNYDEAKSWVKAAGWYHSRTKQFTAPYITKVYKVWKNFIETDYLTKVSNDSNTSKLRITPVRPNPFHKMQKKTPQNIRDLRKQRSLIFVKK